MAEPGFPPLVLLSGLAADSRVFAPQKLRFPSLIIPAWPIPLSNESLDAYAQRLAAQLGPLDRPVIGGASFGGIVALHLARHLRPRAVILIGSIRRPTEFPPWIRVARVLRHFVRFIPVRVVQYLVAPFTSRWAMRIAPHLSGVLSQFRQADPLVFRWSLRALLEWSQSPELECPIHHIHGQGDFVLPACYAKPDTCISGGGHVISLTHSREVNEFIRTVISQFAEGTTDCR